MYEICLYLITKYKPSTILTTTTTKKNRFSTSAFIFGKCPVPLKYPAAVDSAELYYKALCQYLK